MNTSLANLAIKYFNLLTGSPDHAELFGVLMDALDDADLKEQYAHQEMVKKELCWFIKSYALYQAASDFLFASDFKIIEQMQLEELFRQDGYGREFWQYFLHHSNDFGRRLLIQLKYFAGPRTRETEIGFKGLEHFRINWNEAYRKILNPNLEIMQIGIDVQKQMRLEIPVRMRLAKLFKMKTHKYWFSEYKEKCKNGTWFSM